MPASRRIFRITQILLLCFPCLLLRLGASAQEPPKPFSKSEIVDLLQAEASPAHVAELARKRGIDFKVTPEIEKELRGAGATTELLDTLRELAPKPPPALLQIESAPKGAEIYVDDEFKGQVSREGRLKIPGLSPEKHVVRISADGYKEKVETLELTPGETRTYTPSLVSAAPPPAPPGPKTVLDAPGISMYYESSGENAKLTLKVHAGDSPVIYVDVNGDGRLNRGDTAYGLMNDERPCTQYLLAPGANTPCGTFHSRSALQVKREGDSTQYIWTIPKSELTSDGKSVQFTVGVYSPAARKWSNYPSEPFINPVRIQF